MIDTIGFCQRLEQGIADYPNPPDEDKLFDKVSTARKPQGEKKYQKRYLHNGAVVVNYSTFKPKRDPAKTSDHIFVNVTSLSYLIGESTNLATVSPQHLKVALRNLQCILNDAKISFNVFEAFVCRLDLTVSLIVPNPAATYFPILRMIAPKEYEKIEYDGRNLTYKKNNANSVVIYDKVGQLKENRHPIAEPLWQYGLDKKHCLRFEHQYRDGREVQKYLQIATVQDLLQNANRLANHIKDEFRQWLTPQDFPQNLRRSMNQTEIENTILQMHGSGSEGVIFHLTKLRECNMNINEAKQVISFIKGISNQRFLNRTEHALDVAMQIQRRIERYNHKDMLVQLIQAIRKPVWSHHKLTVRTPSCR